MAGQEETVRIDYTSWIDAGKPNVKNSRVDDCFKAIEPIWIIYVCEDVLVGILDEAFRTPTPQTVLAAASTGKSMLDGFTMWCNLTDEERLTVFARCLGYIES